MNINKARLAIVEMNCWWMLAGGVQKLQLTERIVWTGEEVAINTAAVCLAGQHSCKKFPAQTTGL